MRILGIDIGSRTIKIVLCDCGHMVLERVTDTTHDPLHVCEQLVTPLERDRIVATGYGRRLFQQRWPEAEIITELKAVSSGARLLHPSCRTIIDIGGQDTKVISLDNNGAMCKFAMNDRCAAGTGRFFEVMASALSFTLDEFVGGAKSAQRAEQLSSMCTVFAETEVISLVARGAAREEIALGIHQSIATRTVALLGGIPIKDDILFTGGGARNSCLGILLETALGKKLHVPQAPQTVAALGCALSSR
ncbi:MAG: 3-hydroxyacyl-ACP dehydratase [Deltaproteobacteria bacterium]|nr:3-hydroxyacyl-ACP dehydratase [Deltaproteobacteria bacterium]